MALYKEIELGNGLVVRYHRISSIINTTNVETIIRLVSYPSAEKRQEELDWLEKRRTQIESNENVDDVEPMNVFSVGTGITIPYDENMNIQSAYKYLKTLDEYANSIDV